MKKNILKICLGILLLCSNFGFSQNTTTIDYSTFSSTFCNIFGNLIAVSGINHQTAIGQPTFNTINQSVQLAYDYNSGAQKGTSYKIYYNFKKDYSYKIVITAQNATVSSKSTELKVFFGDNSYSSTCVGPENVSSITGDFAYSTGTIYSQSFTDQERISGQLSTSQSCLTLMTYSGIVNVSPQQQTIEIKKIKIIETPPPPTFSLSPTTTAINCNSTGAVNFSISNVYNSPGTLSYSWNVGNGWNLSPGIYSTTSNTFTLIPTSYPHANITATPILNGVAQPTKTSMVTLSPFTSSATISGIDSFCTYPSTSTFTINAGVGNTVTWSSSNSGVATISSGTNSLVTLTSQSQGQFTLNALLTNSCGQTITISKIITVGSPLPTIDGYTCVSDSAPCPLSVTANNNYLTFSLSASTGTYIPLDSDWQWEKISGNFYFLDNGQYNSLTHTGKQGNIYITGANPTNNPLQLRCRVRTSCDWGNWRTYTWNDGTTTPPPPPVQMNYYRITTNPVTTALVVSLVNSNIYPTTTSSKLAKIYNQNGSYFGSFIINANPYIYTGVSWLSPGYYILNITFDDQFQNINFLKQ